MPWAVAAAAVAGAATLGSGALSSSAASSASKAQQAEQQQALALQQGYYATDQGNLQPAINAGMNATTNLANLTGNGTGPGNNNPLTAPLTAQFQPTMTQLAATPGYQFTLGQGLKATQNSLAAQGLGGSGQALAGAANYAGGLASSTYNQQLQNYLAQNQQTYNMLAGVQGMGQNAAISLSNTGLGTGTQVGQTLGNIGNAAASGILGSAAATSNSLNSTGGQAAGALASYPLYQQLLNNSNNNNGSVSNPYPLDTTGANGDTGWFTPS